jgi:hypothetical protein
MRGAAIFLLVRRIAGLLVASAAAPYLFAVILVLFSRPVLSGDPFAALDAVATIGTLGLAFLGLPSLGMAALLAIVAEVAEWASLRAAALAGAALGLCFGGSFVHSGLMRGESVVALATGAATGAASGAIYWLVARSGSRSPAVT